MFRLTKNALQKAPKLAKKSPTAFSRKDGDTDPLGQKIDNQKLQQMLDFQNNVNKFSLHEKYQKLIPLDKLARNNLDADDNKIEAFLVNQSKNLPEIAHFIRHHARIVAQQDPVISKLAMITGFDLEDRIRVYPDRPEIVACKTKSTDFYSNYQSAIIINPNALINLYPCINFKTSLWSMLSSKPKSQATLDCTITELLRHELIHYYDETLFNKITAACVSLQESHGTPLIFEPSPHGFDSQKNRLISELRAYFFSGMIKFHHPNFSDDEIIDKIVSEAVKSIQPVKFSSQRTDFTNEGEMQDFARAKLVESCENDHYLIKDLIDFCGFDHVL